MKESMEVVSDMVKEIVAGHLGVDLSDISNDSTLQSLGGDSLDEIEILINLEDVLGIEIDDDEIEKVKTFGELVEFLHRI